MGKAWLGLGANIGDPAAQLREALRRLGERPDLTITAQSQPVTTRAGRARQPDAVHLAVGIDTTLKPMALLDVCLSIEQAMGRVHRQVWAQQLIDIDMLAYDDIEIRSARLVLPHPFAHQREFVIGPLREIAPDVADWVIKVNTKPR